jgi:CheY-like chemotaxis protein
MPRTLFLADDSVTIRKVVELAFHDTDVRVIAVGSGREALERLPATLPDIVLADVVMPGPTGYEICRSVKASAKPVPVLLLAGTFEPFDADEARDCGADGYVTKPFDSRTLVERIETILATGPAARATWPAPRPVAPSEPDPDVEAIFRELAVPAVPAPAPAPVPIAVAVRPPEPEPAPLEAAAVPVAVIEPPAPPAPAPAPTPAPVTESRTTLTPADVDAIARAVVERLTDRVLREIVWERLRELERETD